MGTSLTAGYGLDDPQVESWPGVIQQIADSVGIPLHVTNAGVSGETSAGALRRSEWLFRQPYDLLVLETGANDGLRGVDPDSTAANIRAIIQRAKSTHPEARILLVQMEAPTNMGPRYTRAFHEIFPRVAIESGVTLLPFLLEGVGGIAKYNQGDGIHPTAEGARMAARNAWPGIRLSLQPR
jgi:acyl-CoA thioesterase-1